MNKQQASGAKFYAEKSPGAESSTRVLRDKIRAVIGHLCSLKVPFAVWPIDPAGAGGILQGLPSAFGIAYDTYNTWQAWPYRG
ncbi:hypothetical protein DM813_20215 [Pseudomonas alkylphenolica]|uniref:Uncharacterized protein n=1 Tax=Pseudomonas alkylphenolica TaxID=237609 RepID=A0A443ZQY0_9PSED|nr:hypothetical protein [Pseudomonas alkylphenolica]RWU21500.1 hypothetical protein DM813_20215 [Pseudomonas alkylphenolica]